MGVRLPVLLAAVALASGAASADAAADEEECPAGHSCFTVTVPLDRSGAVAGEVDLWVERIPAERATRPPLFVIAPGPGASATWAYGNGWAEHLVPGASRSRDIVLIDQRGTGRSEPLSCPELQSTPPLYWSRDDIAACAVVLGPRHAFHSVTDVADDIDAVRDFIGADQVALYGDTSGAQIALDFARRHPERVERLLLRSPRAADLLDPFFRTSLQAVPRLLSELCPRSDSCPATTDLLGDVRELAARLERQPLEGTVTDARGRLAAAEMDGYDLLNLIAAGELDPFLLAELPSAVHSALRGDALPLLRSYYGPLDASEDEPPFEVSARRFSYAAYLAARCPGSDLPWSAATPQVDRLPRAEWLGQTFAPGTFGPFGAATALRPVIARCAHWPAETRAEDGARPLPPAPALVIAGERSIVAPLEVAREVATALPAGRLLVVPGAGYDVLESPVDCERVVAARFLAGEPPSGERPCRAADAIRPVAPLPWTLRDLPAADGDDAGRALAAVRRTIQDAFAWLYHVATEPGTDDGRRVRTGALRGGSYVLGRRRPDRDRVVRLEWASAVEGVAVDGRMAPYDSDLSRSRGRFVVGGAAGVEGRLRLRDGVLSGRLGGRYVRGELTMDFVEVVGVDFRR